MLEQVSQEYVVMLSVIVVFVVYLLYELVKPVLDYLGYKGKLNDESFRFVQAGSALLIGYLFTYFSDLNFVAALGSWSDSPTTQTISAILIAALPIVITNVMRFRHNSDAFVGTLYDSLEDGKITVDEAAELLMLLAHEEGKSVMIQFDETELGADNPYQTRVVMAEPKEVKPRFADDCVDCDKE